MHILIVSIVRICKPAKIQRICFGTCYEPVLNKRKFVRMSNSGLLLNIEVSAGSYPLEILYWVMLRWELNDIIGCRRPL